MTDKKVTQQLSLKRTKTTGTKGYKMNSLQAQWDIWGRVYIVGLAEYGSEGAKEGANEAAEAFREQFKKQVEVDTYRHGLVTLKDTSGDYL